MDIDWKVEPPFAIDEFMKTFEKGAMTSVDAVPITNLYEKYKEESADRNFKQGDSFLVGQRNIHQDGSHADDLLKEPLLIKKGHHVGPSVSNMTSPVESVKPKEDLYNHYYDKDTGLTYHSLKAGDEWFKKLFLEHSQPSTQKLVISDMSSNAHQG